MVRLKERGKQITVNYFSNFNSTMVRLKEVVCFSKTLLCIDFNSTMVRLKGICNVPNAVQLQYFNSTMVRLKGGKRSNRSRKSFSISIPLWFG